MKSTDRVKLDALEYAEKNKIVNQKSIQAYIAGYNSCKAEHTAQEMVNRLYDMYYRTKEDIYSQYQMDEAYSGYDRAKDIKLKLTKEKEFAVKLKEIFAELNKK